MSGPASRSARLAGESGLQAVNRIRLVQKSKFRDLLAVISLADQLAFSYNPSKRLEVLGEIHSGLHD